MIQHLSIKNYATVEHLEIEFSSNLTAISGETGAGKSIILGGLSLALGDRADKGIVRFGNNKTEITAVFDVSEIAESRHWLIKNELIDSDNPECCVVRRVIGSDGRSKGFINGTLSPMMHLKTLGEMLVDIHSQHEHQSLLKRATHQRLLDEFGVPEKLREELEGSYKSWQKNNQLLSELRSSKSTDQANEQLLRYQLSELDELALIHNEFEALEAQHRNLSNADETILGLQASLELCAGKENNHNDDVKSMLEKTISHLTSLKHTDEAVDAVLQVIENASIQIDEAVSDLRRLLDGIQTDPRELEKVNNRIGVLHETARKHKVKPNALVELAEEIRRRLTAFSLEDSELEKLADENVRLKERYEKVAARISKERIKAAKSLEASVNRQLKKLGMQHAQFFVTLTPIEYQKPNATGLEIIEFLVTTNSGQPPGPLSKIASGGELSRISLAIQVSTAQTTQTPSLVFDEVDVGIGGGIAKVVGELLRHLGQHSQILCVTHQAQVAAQCHNHFFVEKSDSGDGPNQVVTQIRQLNKLDRIEEIARMLGGSEFSKESLAHAKTLFASPQK